MKKRKSVDLLPVIFRTDANQKFLSGTLDQLIQQPELKKIDGFIGSSVVKNFNPEIDSYVNDKNNNDFRNVYELEPGIVLKNKINDEVISAKTYEDILNSLAFFGADVKNQDNLFKQQSYSWTPHIDLDKFVNYRNYFWLPSGPQTILITGDEQEISSTIYVSIKEDQNGRFWSFSNEQEKQNPTLTLYRGITYIFEVEDLEDGLFIRQNRTGDSLTEEQGVFNNGTLNGEVVFEVGTTTPGSLYYTSGFDDSLFGKILVRNRTEKTEFNVETDIIGKKEYQIEQGFNLSNGMRVTFSDDVLPESYRNKSFIVEGVGEKIVLVDFESLVTIENYASRIESGFDIDGFDDLPFDEVSEYPVDPDYILINRASKDKNPWSRYNRWFHLDVIEATARYNKTEMFFDDNVRAKRPIIEFKADIQLFNFSDKSKKYVDFLDDSITDAFSKIEGSLGFYIDGFSLEQGNRIIFTKDEDKDVRNKIYQVEFLDIEGVRKLHLQSTDDSISTDNEGLLVLRGNSNGRTSWIYKNDSWVKSQTKDGLNQLPLFDIFDDQGDSYGSEKYLENNFTGSKLFGYQVGIGSPDSVLGFPIKFGNVSNVGGYLFEDYLSSENWNYFDSDGNLKILSSKNGFLKFNKDTIEYKNSWIKCDQQSLQEIIEQKISVGGETFLEFDSIDVRTPATHVRVFKNGNILSNNDYTITVDAVFNSYFVNFNQSLQKNDVVTIRANSDFQKLETGYYETPINLINNPLNQHPYSITFSEISDHLNSMILNASKSLLKDIDQNNLRDQENLEKYGRRFVQHDGLVAIAGSLLLDKDVNIINSLRFASLEYQRYKTLILQKFIELEAYNTVSEALDRILTDISKNKILSEPFYYSDMVPYGSNKRVFDYEVKEASRKNYSYGTEKFDINILSNKAVLVYVNSEQLVFGKDYVFDDINPAVTLKIDLNIGDKIRLVFFNNTHGSCMPFSPTKLGLYPAYRPEIYLDNTYLEPTTVIQGHDGSITIAYGDDRDLLLLELEKRIFNNLKQKYDPEIFDINDVVPGIFRKNKNNLSKINRILEKEFLRWSGIYSVDYRTNINSEIDSSFGYNFIDAVSNVDNDIVLQGTWRKIYRYYYDTERPHTHPWEMLGFDTEPTWWQEEYGPAPYTSGNSILWQDLESGYIRQGNRKGYHEKYERKGLSNVIPVDSYGDIRDPIQINIIKEFNFAERYKQWSFGDQGPAENAWRKSSSYPFALQIAMMLTLPAKYSTQCFDLSKIKFNSAGQPVYSLTNQRITPKELKVFSEVVDNERILTSGFNPLIIEYLRNKFTNPVEKFKSYFNNMESLLVYKIGGFASKDKFNVSLETVTSNKTINQIFVPEENYQIILNSGFPKKTLTMSGIIIERTDRGFVVKGYDSINPYFTILNAIPSSSDPVITVGGVSESFIYWNSNSNVNSGTIVENNGSYYRAISNHITGQVFDSKLYYPLPFLPKTGGVESFIPQVFEETETIVSYGTLFPSIQDVVNFILSYGKWTEKNGFIFDTIISELEVVSDWLLSAKEFMFWSSQNWNENSIISVSPFSPKISFSSADAVVDDVYNDFYEYTLLKSDGSAIDKNKVSILRDGGRFDLDTSKLSNDGVYFIRLNLVQKEHVAVFDNKTVFGDLIYEPSSGYRQERFKIKGIITDGWNGDYYVPGFVYDSAKIEDWQPNVDYRIGDVVKHQTFFYQAKKNLLPVDDLQYEDWERLGSKPVAKLLPNFEYKIDQFEDFYSLDTANFDNSQQKFAQKLIGYVPRNYLNSLILDETSQYKFYQGYIKEKGTKAPLDKFSVAHNDILGSHIELEEEWAIRLGTFGGEESYKEIEFTLDQNKFSQDPQIFEFEFGDQKATSEKSYAVPSDSILIKPDDFDGRPWPLLSIDSTNSYKQYQKLPTAGYVRLDDVTFTALFENNILTLSDIPSLREGDTIWIAMDSTGEWNVKRFTIAIAKIISYTVDNENNLIEFVTDVDHDFKLRDFVAITKIPDPLNTVYEVIGISSPNTFVVQTQFNDLEEPTALLNGIIYYFADSRVSTLEEISTIPGLARWQNCELVWVDDAGDGTWAVLQKEQSVKATPLRPLTENSNQHFGKTVKISPKAKNIIVSATNVERGRVYVYERKLLGSDQVNILQSYLFEENFSDILSFQNIKNGVTVPEMPRNHGQSLDCWESDDLVKRYIVSGAPNTSNAKWIDPAISSPPVKKQLRFNLLSSGIFDEGAIKITKFDNIDKRYVTDEVLASPVAQPEANFGYDVKFAGSDSPILFVSSPGQNQSQGSVFVFYLDENSTWQVVLENDIPYDIRSEVNNIGSDSYFGSSISVSVDGKYLAVSAPDYLKDRTQVHKGAVFVFEKDPVEIKYSLIQTIYADDYLEPRDLILKGVINTYSTDDESFSFTANNNSLNRSNGNFIQDGFRIGQTVAIQGTTSNDGEYVISDINSQALFFSDSADIQEENVLSQFVITGLGSIRRDRFGDKITIDSSGNLLLISSDHSLGNKLDAGMVYVLKKSSGQFILDQKIYSPSEASGEMFGSNISISPDGKTLLVTASGGSQNVPMNFDSYTERFSDSLELYGSEYVLNPASVLSNRRTTFDNGSTRFSDTPKNSGVVYLFQELGNKFVFGESLLSGDAAANDQYGSGIDTDGDFCLIGAPKYDLKVSESLNETGELVTATDAGTVIIFDKKDDHCGCGNSWSWTKIRSLDEGLVDVDKIKKVISYDNNNFSNLEYYEIFDPVKGKLPSKVSEEIKYVSPFDPAVYTLSVDTNAKIRVDNKTTWTEDHVGEMWLDTSTLRYMWYEQGTAEFRSNNWGQLFPGSTVDVYEWVKSDYRPSEWAQLADTPEGLTLGISGQPKNPDNTVVSINQYFDPIVNDFINVYYFWVRNKITLPDLNFRSISSFECARIIEDPKTQGIKYAAFLSPQSLGLTNASKNLNADKVNINIYYQTVEEDINRHSHWQLISENEKYFTLDDSIVNKLIDSLVGQDVEGNLVPDPTLSPKLKYGTLYRPRQSWFKNREKALSVMINYVNDILKKYDIVGRVDVSKLESFEEYPLEKLGYYDQTVLTEEDLSTVGTLNKVTAQLESTVVNGRLTDVTIINSGLGYKIQPTVDVVGDGSGAKIETVIDSSGRIAAVRILSQGVGYTSPPRLIIRPFAVLVENDTSINRWAIYHLEDSQYKRKISQTFDVRRYWNYIDWVDASFDSSIPATHVIRFTSDIDTIQVDIGDTVEVRNTGDGRKIILRKTLAGVGNYIDDYDLVFRENGTLEFSEKLYNKFLAGTGFDTFVNYDKNSYDETLSKELRIILETIRRDIFTKNFSIYWNKFIFTAIRYLLSEQLFVDWIYKTSFIKPVVDAGELDQKNIYRFNDFSYVEDFIKEIKPFKSKIRGFTVKQSKTDLVNLNITDFDLPSYIDEFGNVRIPTQAMIQTQSPFKDWYDNFAYGVKEIRISDGGNGYRIPPVINIVAQSGDTGAGAKAISRINNGSISEIVVTDPGSGYLKTPRIVIIGGGNYLENFKPASAYAVLMNGKVRNNSIIMKFDRTSEKGLFTGEIYNRNITTDGSTLNYLLTYPVDDNDSNYPALQDKDTIKLFVNDSELSTDNYRIIFRPDLSTLISFNVALPANQRLRIQYIKNTLYTKDIFVQNETQKLDTFKLTFPPELDPQKMIVQIINTNNNTGSEILSSDYRIILKQESVGFRKYVGFIKFNNTPNLGDTISVQYAKNINILNAVDRIITKYEPTDNMPGKDVQQLMKGIGFGGVEIQGLNFSVSSGWDGLPWFTQGWDTFLNEYRDLLVISDGVKNTYQLGYVPTTGTNINVYFDGVRVDDEQFGTINQKNANALFNTIIADGSSNSLTLPVVPENGVKIEIRQSLSDGVTLPSDEIVLDTNLGGGDFTTVVDAGETKFKTASGLKPDDINVEGGQFLSVEHSPSTEEMIRSEIFDSVSISVFNSPRSGSNQIETFQFQYDGSSNVFNIPGIIDNENSLDVYIDNFLTDRTSDYAISYGQDETIVTLLTTDYGISEASETKRFIVTIQKMSIGGDEILNRQRYVVTAQDAAADVITIEMPVNINDIGSYYISTNKNNRLEKLSGRSKRSKIVIENTAPKLTEGTNITIILFASFIKTYSEIYNQEITISNTLTYALTRPPGTIEPLHVMAIASRLTPSTINWQGNWIENQNYLVNDTVVYKNKSYVCKVAHLSFSEQSLIQATPWQISTVYRVGDLISYANNIYVCLQAHTSSSVLETQDDQLWSLLEINNPTSALSEVYWELLPKQRLTPAETEYYEVISATQSFNIGQNIPYVPRTLTAFDIEVYKNGKKLVIGRDYEFDFVNNIVNLTAGTYRIGDVVAISVLKNADFLIRNGNIIFTNNANVKPNQRIVVTTYTNHDENLMRREVFRGYQRRNEYKLSRPVFDIKNVWVDLNGRLLIPNIDFRIFDREYIKITDEIEIQDNDRVVVTSISDLTSGVSTAYRIIKDMRNSYQFKRISKTASTTLIRNLTPTDRSIEVLDPSIFGTILPTSKNPGVLYIAGERIEFRRIEGNFLRDITRGTMGTGVAPLYVQGTKLFNMAQSETVPYREGSILSTFVTPEGHRYNQELSRYEKLNNGSYTVADDLGTYQLLNHIFKEGVPFEDQISVYMGGRLLMKPPREGNKVVTHDFSVTLFSDEKNSQGESGEIALPPDFVIEKINGDFFLKINPDVFFKTESLELIPNIQIKVVQKIGKIWYTLNSDATIQQDNTVQSKFLQDSFAELPDKYYYAVSQTLTSTFLKSEDDDFLTDEPGNNLERD